MSAVFSAFQNVWWFLVLIGIMIVIHELGHYLAARYFDVHIEAFSIGFGKRLFGFRRGETDFKVCVIPYGGYVKMAGEQPGEDATSDPRSFLAKPRWQRLIIAAAGPFMNIVLAVALLTGLFMVVYPKQANAGQPATIGYIQPNSPAARAGLHEGDRILQIDDVVNPDWEQVHLKEIAFSHRPLVLEVQHGDQKTRHTILPALDEKTGVSNTGWSEQTDMQIAGVLSGMEAERIGLKADDILVTVNGTHIWSLERLQDILKSSNGAPVELVYLRDGQEHKVTMSATYSASDKKWMLGVKLRPRMILTKLSFSDALHESVRRNEEYAGLIFGFLRDIVERKMSPNRLEGPIRIAQVSGEAARAGSLAFMELMATVSLNLAIFNLLPIPILDGGVILMLLIEMLMRRDLSMPVKETVFKLGFVFLMMVAVFVLYNDITKILLG